MPGKTLKEDKRRKTVLVVEDDEVLLRALYLALKPAGHTIATATDGELALKMAERLKPDIILLDLLLPKMDGFTVLQTLKSNTVLKNIPVVVLSNLGNTKDIARVKDLGASDYFVKADTNLSVLADKIEKL